MQIDGLLLDIDGVLAISWEPIPGSIEALAAFRRARMPVCLITNTTTHTRAGLAHILGEAGFDIQPSEIVTAVTATADYVRVTHPGARCSSCRMATRPTTWAASRWWTEQPTLTSSCLVAPPRTSPTRS